MTRPACPLRHALALALLGSVVACGRGGGTPDAAGVDPPPARAPASGVGTPAPAAQFPARAEEGAGVPDRFQGRYAADVEACSVPGHESRLEIGAREIRFHEGRGPVRSVSAKGNMLALVATLTGEGEAREAAFQFGLSEDGGRLHDLANGMARRRCG